MAPVPQYDPTAIPEEVETNRRLGVLPFEVLWPGDDALAAQVQLGVDAMATHANIYAQFNEAVNELLTDGVCSSENAAGVIAGIHIGVDWMAHWIETAFDVDRATISDDHTIVVGPHVATMAAVCGLINEAAAEDYAALDDDDDDDTDGTEAEVER